MLGGANHNIDADLIARAVIASARAYGDDPIRACTSKAHVLRRPLVAAAAALESEGPWDVRKAALALGISRSAVYQARSANQANFRRAAWAAQDAIRLERRRREDALSDGSALQVAAPAAAAPVAAAPDEAPAEIVADEPIELVAVDMFPEPDLAAAPVAEVTETAATPEPVVEDANAVRVSPPVVPAPAERARPVVAPTRKPYSPERPRPAPYPAPRPVARERKSPKGATVQRLSGGVEVIRLKPITDRMLGHIRAQVENGLDVAEAAELFDVDVDQVTTRLRAAGVKL